MSGVLLGTEQKKVKRTIPKLANETEERIWEESGEVCISVRGLKS